MRRFMVVAVAGLILGLSVRPGAAQVTREDSAAVLLGVAAQLRAEGRTALAESLLDLLLQRYAGTAAAAQAGITREALRGVPEERSGRTELLVFTTGYGLALGALVPVALNLDDPEAFGVGLIAGGPAGYLLGRSILRNRPISEGQARAMSFGTLWGAWQGLGWAYATNLGVREVCDFDLCYVDDPDGQTLVKSTIVGSLAGLGVGAYLARKPIRAGTATTVTLGGFWGTFYGVAVGQFARLDDGDNEMVLTLLAGNAAVLGSALLAPRWNLSRGRARLISITGVAGVLSGLGVLLIVQPDDAREQTIWGTLIGTSAVGLALGTYWTRNHDDRPNLQRGPDGEALLDLSEGRWSLNLPEPGLRLIETRAGVRPAYRPGLAVPLLRAVF